MENLRDNGEVLKHSEILKQCLGEQIALEEHLCALLAEQVSHIDDKYFADAKELLAKAHEVLELHFTPLNQLLDKLETEAAVAHKSAIATNGGNLPSAADPADESRRISRMLRDDYSALNRITISNTLLHTTALALDRQDVATTALNHLENLVPIVVQIGELVPDIVARELRTESPAIDPAVGQTALRNTRQAWRKAPPGV